MTSIPDKAYWPLDYDWSRRGGRWDVHTDVLLLADAGHDPACAQALADWVAQQHQERARVDGVERAIVYAGGVQGYLEGHTLYLHSRGEDAFDSLSHYSREIARFLRRQGCQAALRWTEARHDRPDHQLQWP